MCLCGKWGQGTDNPSESRRPCLTACIQSDASCLSKTFCYGPVRESRLQRICHRPLRPAPTAGTQTFLFTGLRRASVSCDVFRRSRYTGCISINRRSRAFFDKVCTQLRGICSCLPLLCCRFELEALKAQVELLMKDNVGLLPRFSFYKESLNLRICLFSYYLLMFFFL